MHADGCRGQTLSRNYTSGLNTTTKRPTNAVAQVPALSHCRRGIEPSGGPEGCRTPLTSLRQRGSGPTAPLPEPEHALGCQSSPAGPGDLTICEPTHVDGGVTSRRAAHCAPELYSGADEHPRRSGPAPTGRRGAVRARSPAAPPARRRCAGPDMRATIRRTPATFSAICTAVAREAVRTFRMYGDIRGP